MADRGFIHVQGARENNLQGVTVRVPIGAVTAVTGVAGAGKSSLAFDVLYAEGHRRYAETFSPYARQFLERLDRPRADRIEGVLPAVAVDRTAPVRTSRSTVGTMTSVADYLRALFARSAILHCRGCGRPVARDSPSSIFDALVAAAGGEQALLCFRRRVGQVEPEVIRDAFRRSGFGRVLEDGRPVRLEDARLRPGDGHVTVVLDRTVLARDRRQRIVDSLEAALRWGEGRVEARVDGRTDPLRFSTGLHCAACDVAYADPAPALFSFNNPVGACAACKGFGRTMEIDPDLVVPDGRLSVAEGCVRPFQSAHYADCQQDLLRFLRRRRIGADLPWRALSPEAVAAIWEGEPGGREDWRRRWYGIRGFFEWLESRTYRMHVRVLLSRYRRYLPCAACGGARLKPEALSFRLAGRTLPEIEGLPVGESERILREWSPDGKDPAAELLLGEVRGRLRYLVDVGLTYLTLSRQSRTLSGGEAQRVTLATALGGSLTSTLYVLDEPSVGLHPRDVGRLASVLRRLAQAGNAVVVVEHDAALIRTADHVVDLGPGPGREGGQVVYAGPVAGIGAEPRSRTGAFLAGRLRPPSPGRARRPDPERRLRIRGARENNLCGLAVDVPLGLLVCVTGVSGSGKSTLVDQVLYRNVRRRLGLAEPEPGACDGIGGVELVTGVSLVDQSPLGGSSRVNAATYARVLEPLRKAFAGTALARERGLGPAAFSFNSKAGACPACAGAGYEKVELQFLPDALVRCPACDGRRFRPETLEVRCRGYDIASLLDLPAAEVGRLFSDVPAVRRALRPLLDMGVGYLSLSQPASTLSGGEAQRLKLACELAEAGDGAGRLVVLDEPTTGLHAADVSVLVGSLQRMVDRGLSVVVVEHDLDVARAADWIIDLGPEGGDGGGRVVGEGPWEAIARLDTPTGQALRASRSALASSGPLAPSSVAEASPAWSDRDGSVTGGEEPDRPIRILGAREHNLQHVAVDVPRDRLVAVTGVSGSGKSTLAFDVLFAEGQRRFLDCLSTYVRQFIRPLARPDVDRLDGVPPTVALEQKLSHGTPMSTVGTASEVYHYLRLLFARVGVPHCVRCGEPGRVGDPASLAAVLGTDRPDEQVTLLAPLVRGRKGHHREVIAAASRRGIAQVRIDGSIQATAAPTRLDRYQVHDVEAVVDRIVPGPGREDALRSAVVRALEIGGGTLVAASPGRPDQLYSVRRACPRCGGGLAMPDPRLFTFNQRFGACPTCEGFGTEDPDGAALPCAACAGTRLRPEALAVRLRGRNIGEVAALTVRGARRWVDALGGRGNGGLPPEVLERVLPELAGRLELLDRLGLGYLALARGGDTLSTGEGQRIRIAAQLASNLKGVCYVLDEPTVGLHARDSEALGRALVELRDRGNTVVVVEHDDRIIRSADHVIDLGPGAGPLGGRVIATGSPDAITAVEDSVTGRWLRERCQPRRWPRRPLGEARRITVERARLHNLQDLTVDFPLGRLTCVTGVSGSGKSTLVRDVLYRALKARLARRRPPPVLAGVRGGDGVLRALEVDESPIGRTPRSVPATYVGVMDAIRALFAATPDARALGYRPSRFSFNVSGGRCERCEGQGRLRVTMSLLPEVYIPCEACAGRRYNTDTLSVTFKGRSVADVLAMTVDEARELLSSVPAVACPLDFLSGIGLGYLQLGQPSPTLSGGEAQRIKLAAELASSGYGGALYVLDEPTTGLHMADVAKLVDALQKLVDRGDTVVVIEHNLDVVAAADCVVDLGPEGGDEGGRVVAWGKPEQVARVRGSRTGRYLREVLAPAVAHRGGRPRPQPASVAAKDLVPDPGS